MVEAYKRFFAVMGYNISIHLMISFAPIAKK